MAHELHRLLASVYNTPHLVLESSLPPIVDYLQARSKEGFPSFAIVADAKSADPAKQQPVGGIGEIVIDGVLSYKPVMGLCGPQGTSYQGILEQAQELIDEGVDTILMTFSSPGGQAAHCFSTCNDLRSMCDEAGVSLVSYIDELAASAALAFSVIADEVVIHPSASTGSVGCVVALLDRSKALADAGLKPIYIASTPGKTPFETDGSFSSDFLDEIQDDVTRLGNEFAQHVSYYTGIPTDDVLNMDAKVFHADAALSNGLVTAIMDHNTFAKYMADKQGAKNA